MVEGIQAESWFMKFSQTPIQREINKRLVKIIHQLLEHGESVPFRKPVPYRVLGLDDYRNIVKKPTNLNLIRRQHHDNQYGFVQEVLDDIQLCWENCKAYNEVGSPIYQQAETMQSSFYKLVQDHLPELASALESLKSIPPKTYETARKKDQRVTHNLQEPTQQLPMIEPEPIRNDMDESNAKDQILQDPEEPELFSQQLPSAPQIDPITVPFNLKPTEEQIQTLSATLTELGSRGDFEMLSKAAVLLQRFEGEHMHPSEDGSILFDVPCMHISTFHRLAKLLGITQQSLLIE